MKKLVLLVLLIAGETAFGVRATGVSNTDNPQNCNLRLSNLPISQDSPVGGQEYCVGSIINSSMLVTSAHCLNQVTSNRIPNLVNVPESVRIHIAPLGNASSDAAEILPGGQSVVFDEDMATHDQRATYISAPNVNFTKSDVIIVRLKNPVLPYSPNCPQLPTADECREFELFAAAPLGPAKTYEAVGATFYRSGTYNTGAGAGAETDYYPLRNMISAVPNELMRTTAGFYRLEFSNPLIRFERGDSGSGILLQKSQTRKLIVATQSAKTADAGTGYFSNLCRLVNRPNYPVN